MKEFTKQFCSGAPDQGTSDLFSTAPRIPYSASMRPRVRFDSAMCKHVLVVLRKVWLVVENKLCHVFVYIHYTGSQVKLSEKLNGASEVTMDPAGNQHRRSFSKLVETDIAHSVHALRGLYSGAPAGNGYGNASFSKKVSLS